MIRWLSDEVSRLVPPPPKTLSAHDTVAEDKLERRAWRRRGVTRRTRRESHGGNTETDTGWKMMRLGTHSLDSLSTVESSGRVETTSSLRQTLEPFWLRRQPLLPKRHHTNRWPPPHKVVSLIVVQTLYATSRGCSTHNSNITWITSQS